jgi:hypothetical protein
VVDEAAHETGAAGHEKLVGERRVRKTVAASLDEAEPVKGPEQSARRPGVCADEAGELVVRGWSGVERGEDSQLVRGEEGLRDPKSGDHLHDRLSGGRFG